ncbi:MAG: site-specific integrase, partial [Sphingomonas bacterium]|nr:site-specific integrase [Sphingomonas bacterium]
NELRLVWLAAGSLGYPFGPLIRLLILTGQRLREVAELPWAELNLPERKWLLPANRTKNGVATLVPLSDPAMSIVTDLPRIKSDAGKGKPLIAFTTTGDTPVSGFSKIKGRLDATMLEIARKEARDAGADDDAVAALAIEHWQFHDLRRTLASGCQRLGVKLEVSEAILNHVSGTKSGIAGVYHVYKYEDEKRSALDAWARIVNNAVSSADSDNVFRLSAVR